MMRAGWFVLLTLFTAAGGSQSVAYAQKTAPDLPKPDDRYKLDVLVMVAHPDDDTGITNYMFPAVFDQGKRIGVVFTNRGNSGGNAAGIEQSKALADERELEARRSLAAGGITNVWFLHGSDTPTQDVLHSLETLGHGEALEEDVRLIRLTRPQVIITWLPAYVAGENHGDHQAAGVVATEAFDLSGNPAAFAEQLDAPRGFGLSNYGEGLHVWQAKKLYYISDASHPEFLAHRGPLYPADTVIRSKGTTVEALNRIAWNLYATQIDPELEYYVKMPDYTVRAKTLVSSPIEADIWDGIDDKPAVYSPSPVYVPAAGSGVTLELGGPWAFYQQFYRAHDLSAITGLVNPPQAAYSYQRNLWVPLLLHNGTDAAQTVTLDSALPEGWTIADKTIVYHLQPHSTYPAQLQLTGPAIDGKAPPQLLTWTLSNEGKKVGEVSLSVYREFNGVPQ